MVNGQEKIVEPMTFSFIDFLRAFIVPFGSGVAYFLLGIVIFLIAKGAKGMTPFILFNLGVAYYLVALFDFHTTYSASWFYLAVCAVLPALMTHFAIVYPEIPRGLKRVKNVLIIMPYAISLLLYIPYVYTFHVYRTAWQTWESAVVVYMIVSYLVWLGFFIYRIFMETKVIVFIDGFDLYHAIDANPKYHKYKWLVLNKLANLYTTKNEKIVGFLTIKSNRRTFFA